MSIQISQLRGDFVKDKDLIGKQDPYVIFELGGEKVTTEVIKSGGTNVMWNDVYTIRSSSLSTSEPLKVSVYNHNSVMPDTVIGVGNFPLTSERTTATVPLVDKKGKDVGQISFDVSVDGAGFGSSGHVAKGTQSMGTGVRETSSTDTGIGAMAVGAGMGTRSTTDRQYEERDVDGAAVGGVTQGVRDVNLGEEAICEQKAFTKMEDRPVVKERAEYIKEHHEFEKQFVNETRATGRERELRDRQPDEVLDTSQRVVAVTESDPCAGGVCNTGHAHREPDSAWQTKELPRHEQPVCNRDNFAVSEDRPIVLEAKQAIREHHPVEKEFINETRRVGEREVGTGAVESLGVKERIVETTQTTPCSGERVN